MDKLFESIVENSTTKAMKDVDLHASYLDIDNPNSVPTSYKSIFDIRRLSMIAPPGSPTTRPPGTPTYSTPLPTPSTPKRERSESPDIGASKIQKVDGESPAGEDDDNDDKDDDAKENKNYLAETKDLFKDK